MPDRIRKINQKISSFFKQKKAGFSLSKTILSKSDFDRDLRKEKGNSRLNLEKPKELNLYTRCRTTASVGDVFKLKNIFKKVYIKKALALITIFAVIITAYFQNTPYAPVRKNLSLNF